MKRDMDLIRELQDEQARLEQLIARLDGGDGGSVIARDLDGFRYALRRAIDALLRQGAHELAHEATDHSAQALPSPYLLQMAEWLGRRIQFAQRNNPFIAPMIQGAGKATAALQGLEGKALEDAREIQDSSLRSLIREVMETREIRRR